jgi:ABC-type lipoprotein export system ATPase subunit
MRIEKVVAHAFGPLEEETLELAPGMTLAYGPNEAGKSSWHAAIYAGLCGVRRSKGQPVIADREFRDDHKPWDGDRWDVEVLVRLEDGRRIEIRQDLAGRVDSRATDVSLGTDVSNEIMFDGSPDGSRWLGLDRRAFLATACISQAQLLAISDDPDLLQEHIQRAAATRGTDATAAAAVDRLSDFRRAQVGEDRANSTKPLRRAKVALDEAWRALVDAQRRHKAFLQLAAESDTARDLADRAGADLRPFLAAVAADRAEAGRTRAERAAELAARHPDGAPGGLAEADDLGNRVAGVLDAWERRPAPVVLDGADAATLETELGRLPTTPVGDLDPASEVLRAKAEYDRRLEARRLVGDRPSAGIAPASAAPAAGPATTPRREGPRVSGAIGGPPRRAAILGGGALVAAAVGLAALAAGWPAIGVAALVVAGALGAAAILARPREGAGGDRAAAARLEAERLAVDRERAARDAEGRLGAWLRLADERTAALHEAEASLASQLVAHGTSVDDGADLEEGFERYVAACRARSAIARESSRAADLRAALDTRRDLERNAAQAAERLVAVDADLRAVASEVGVAGAADADASTIVEGLRTWQERRSTEIGAQETAILEWRELQTLLEGRSPTELQAEATRLAGLADERAAGLDRRAIADADASLGPDPDRRISDLEAALREARARADLLAGRLAEMERGLPSVAEAEERVAAAEVEVARVTGLDAVLQKTIELLRQAEARIHRDLAPVLNAAIAARLPRISGGRYVEAAVDPADLAIKVKAADDGRWREARRLSHGTREQIYLLLRLAMTEQLVRGGEIAPLLCDEVTVQSDQDRARAILDLLHEASRDRQVLVFTHDERALTWADENLDGPDDRLVRLGPALVRPGLPG